MCRGFRNFVGFWHNFVLAKLAASSIMVNTFISQMLNLGNGPVKRAVIFRNIKVIANEMKPTGLV